MLFIVWMREIVTRIWPTYNNTFANSDQKGPEAGSETDVYADLGAAVKSGGYVGEDAGVQPGRLRHISL